MTNAAPANDTASSAESVAALHALVMQSLDDDQAQETISIPLEGKSSSSDALLAELKEHVVKEIGALARPEAIIFTDVLPKTRSGKIMRRLLRDIACGRASQGDTSTLEDASVLEQLRQED